MEPRCLAPTGDVTGEGVLFDEARQCVWWVDINRFLIHAYDLAAASVKSWAFETPPTALALTTDDDQLLATFADHVALWSPGTGREERLAAFAGYPRQRLNDAGVDPEGRCWVGSMANNVGPEGETVAVRDGEGALMRLGPGGLEPVLDGIGIANTVVWPKGGERLYFADTLRNRVDRYAFDAAAGALGPVEAHLRDFERGLPDGSAIDEEGCLWNCRWGGACLVRVAPDGAIAAIVEMPVANITNACFGGPERRTLFVTTATAEKRPTDRLAGSLFAIEVEVPGLPERRFRI